MSYIHIFMSLHVVKLEPWKFIVHQGSQLCLSQLKILLTFPKTLAMASYLPSHQDMALYLPLIPPLLQCKQLYLG